MGERRNPDCRIDFANTVGDQAIAGSLGINLKSAMLCAIAGVEPEIGPCEQMRYAVIAKDEPTYDWIVSQGSKLKLPLPPEMIAEAAAHLAATGGMGRLAEGQNAHKLALETGSFSACCSRSKEVSIVMVGTVDSEITNPPTKAIRFTVGHGTVVRAITEPGNFGPTGKELIRRIEVSYNSDFKACQE